MKRIKYLILILGIFAGFALPLIPANAGAAWDPLPCNTAEEKATAVCNDKGSNTFTNVVQTIVNTLLYILAAVCVVVIIIAGITYTTSGGDSALVAKAKKYPVIRNSRISGCDIGISYRKLCDRSIRGVTYLSVLNKILNI